MLCALIMAGGKGTRFWPLSTEEHPKQFLDLVGNKSMIQMTVSRLLDVIPMEKIFIATDYKYLELVQQHLPEIPSENIFIEPVGRNTAPCIAFSAMQIEKKYPGCNLVVLPSDHLIKDEKQFQHIIKAANIFIDKNPTSIVTLGMKVTRPETGYGYIKYAYSEDIIDNFKFYSVEKFIEKPTESIAISYMKDGNYLWNGGVFLWRVENIINLTQKYLPKTYNLLSAIVNSKEEDFEAKLFELYQEVDNVSIDYGVMEKVSGIYVIPSDFGWDDIGSWLSLERYRKYDQNNNIIDGEVRTIDSNSNIVISQTKPMVLCGVNDLILVETKDVIMIVSKQDVSRVNELKSII